VLIAGKALLLIALAADAGLQKRYPRAAPAESAGPGEIIRFILPQKSSRLLGDGPRLCGIRIPVEAWLFRILILGKSKEKEQEVVTNAG